MKSRSSPADASVMGTRVDRLRQVPEPLRLMRGSPYHRWALLLAATITLLPPGAWSLCLDRAGHLAIEPTIAKCSENSAQDAGLDPDCGAASHETCEDYVLLHGQLTTVRDSQSLRSAIQAVAIVPVSMATALPITLDPPLLASRSHAPPLPTAPIILRC